MAATIATLCEVLRNAPGNLVLSIQLENETINIGVKEIRMSQITIFSDGKDNIKNNNCILVLERSK